MSKENLEVIRRLFEAVERRDLAGVLAAYDSEITIREADSLPYGGVYHGFDGGQKHAAGYVRAWGNFQTANEQKMDAEFLDAGNMVVVLWRQRATNGERKFDSSAASVYKLRNGKIVESEMFQDTAAVLQFLESEE
ncbi:MAG: nuclear transport factor 2 family protein [Acidobacteria bacterium]|nr:nuclear transport factor 2 family protein [Acidobacteriota bacterium]